MTQMTLQFPDLTRLAKFRFMLKESRLEMNVRHLTITCDCSTETIQEAISGYDAKVLVGQRALEIQ
jgi:hypothetical protein